MPKASDIVKLEVAARAEERSFRACVLDLADEYENLQTRFDTLASSQREQRPRPGVEESAPANAYLLAEIAQLKDRLQHVETAASERSELHMEVTMFSEEMARVTSAARHMEERLGDAEALAEMQASLVVNARTKAAAEVEAAEEIRRVAETLARTQVEATDVARAKAVAETRRAETAETKLLFEAEIVEDMKRAEKARLMSKAGMSFAQTSSGERAKPDSAEMLAEALAQLQTDEEARVVAGGEGKLLASTFAKAIAAEEATCVAAADTGVDIDVQDTRTAQQNAYATVTAGTGTADPDSAKAATKAPPLLKAQGEQHCIPAGPQNDNARFDGDSFAVAKRDQLLANIRAQEDADAKSSEDKCRTIRKTPGKQGPGLESETDDKERLPAIPGAISSHKALQRVRIHERTQSDDGQEVARNWSRKCTLSSISRSPWIGSYKHRPAAQCRLFVFYGAGAHGKNFESWQRTVMQHYPEIELVVFEYPGHGDRGDDFISDMSSFEDEFHTCVLQDSRGLECCFNCSYAVVGLSSSARLALGIIKTLVRLGAKPEKFYVVGGCPPLTAALEQDLQRRPAEALPFLDWVAERYMASNSQLAKKAFRNMSRLELDRSYHCWLADLSLSATPYPPLPRKWLVAHPEGRLVKRPESDRTRMLQITRQAGSVVSVTGREETGPRGDHWVQIDTACEDVKPGWLLTHGKMVGIDSFLLDPVLDDAESRPVDKNTQFWKAPVPFQIHYSTGDLTMPCEDPTGHLPPMRDWDRLTDTKPEFVEYEDVSHGKLLIDTDVLCNICEDLLDVCKLR